MTASSFPPPTDRERQIANAEGNLRILQGEVFGALLRAYIGSGDTVATGVALEADEDGNYTGRIFMDRPSGRYVVTVEHAPEEN